MKIKEKFKISLLVLTTFILFGGSVLFLVYVNRSVTEKRNLELNRYLKSVESTIINRLVAK